MSDVLNEARDLNVYKKLLKIFGEYTDKFPATGVDRLLNKALSVGLKAIPKDKKALEILESVLYSDKSVPAKVQELLNARFSDLYVARRPRYKVGNAIECAFWNCDDKLYDKVISLIDLEGTAKTCFWSDASRKKVDILDLVED